MQTSCNEPEGGAGDKKSVNFLKLLPKAGWRALCYVVGQLPVMVIVTREGYSLVVVGDWSFEAFRHVSYELEKELNSFEVEAPTEGDFLKGPNGSELPAIVLKHCRNALIGAAVRDDIEVDGRSFVSCCWSGGIKFGHSQIFGPLAVPSNKFLAAAGYRKCRFGVTNEPEGPYSLRPLFRQFREDLWLPRDNFVPRLKMMPNLVTMQEEFSFSSHWSKADRCQCSGVSYLDVLRDLGDDGGDIISVVEAAHAAEEH